MHPSGELHKVQELGSLLNAWKVKFVSQKYIWRGAWAKSRLNSLAGPMIFYMALAVWHRENENNFAPQAATFQMKHNDGKLLVP